MGAWGAGIFEDDLALDVKLDFEAYLDQGLSIREATKMILEDYEIELEDEDEQVIIYYVLAALQLEQGKVLESIKKKAITFIDQEKGLELWIESGEDVYLDRLRVLTELKRSLQSKKKA